MSNFFEEHGPSISAKDVRALAITLGREQPTPEALARSKKTLERDEDNYWPLTGEWPPEEVSKLNNGHADDSGPVYGTTRSATWVTASTTMQEKAVGSIQAHSPRHLSVLNRTIAKSWKSKKRSVCVH